VCVCVRVCVCVCVCVVVVFKRQREPRVLTCTFLIYARTQSFSQANYYKIIRDVALNNLANRPVDKTIFFSLLICFKYFTDRNNDSPPHEKSKKKKNSLLANPKYFLKFSHFCCCCCCLFRFIVIWNWNLLIIDLFFVCFFFVFCFLSNLKWRQKGTTLYS